jgi:hypothetical protein
MNAGRPDIGTMDQRVTEPANKLRVRAGRARAMPLARRRNRWVRVAAGMLAVAALAMAMAGGGIYLLLRGDTVDNSSLNSALQSAVQRIAGPGLSIDLGRTSVEFRGDWLLTVSGRDISVKRSADGVEVARLGKIDAGVEPLSIFRGQPVVRAIRVRDTEIDPALLFPGEASAMPASLDAGLSALMAMLHRQAEHLDETRFRDVELANVALRGIAAGSRGGPLRIETLKFSIDGNGNLSGKGTIVSRTSKSTLALGYADADKGRKALNLAIDGVSLQEWFPGIDDARSFIASDMLLRFDFLAETENGELSGDPALTISSGAGRMRIGKSEAFAVAPLTANFRLLASRNQIELDPIAISAGQVNARIIGGVRPVNDATGFAGPLQFELIADPAVRAPSAVGQPSVTSSIQALGTFDRRNRTVDIPDLIALVGKDQLRGSMRIDFNGRSPAFRADLKSAGMSVAAAKNFWPAFVAAPARAWFDANVVGGRIADFALASDIPPGVLGYLHDGARIEAGQFSLAARFSGVRADTFGEFPALRNAVGEIAMTGTRLAVKVDQAESFAGSDRAIRISAGEFAIANVATPHPVADIRFRGEGAAASLAAAANVRPLHLAQWVGTDLSRLAGNAALDAILRVPLTKTDKENVLDWRLKVGLSGVASDAPVFGYRVANGDLAIEVNRDTVKVAGEAVLDGFPARVDVTEPLDRNSDKSERKIQLTLDDKARARNGMTLDPVLTGVVRIAVTQSGKRGPAYSADLSDAVIDLPWIGWRKGKGIAARATFKASRKGADTRLDDLYLEGQGFSIAGSLAFAKSGLVSADFADVSLNAGDSLSVKLTRKGASYAIQAEGARFDARGLINKLIHVGGFGDEQGSSDITVQAKIGAVKGFGDATLQNVALTYGTAKGWFNNLSLRGSFSESNYVSLVATTSGRRTVMDVDATNAGQAMRMADFYRRMRGGRVQARLTRDADGPFRGPVRFSDFILDGEPLLKQLVSEPPPGIVDRDTDAAQLRRELSKVETDAVRFSEARADIDKGSGYFRVANGALRNSRVGIAVDGTLYNSANRMDIAGTFMPGIGLSRAIGLIPIVGQILGDGRDTSLIGVNFRLSGPAKDPLVEINPISAVTPGVFRKIFEFKTE